MEVIAALVPSLVVAVAFIAVVRVVLRHSGSDDELDLRPRRDVLPDEDPVERER